MTGTGSPRSSSSSTSSSSSPSPRSPGSSPTTHLGGPAPGGADPRRAVVGVGRLRLADEHPRSGGGSRPARRVRLDRRHAHRRARHAERLRRRRRGLRRRLPHRARPPPRPVRHRRPRGSRAARAVLRIAPTAILGPALLVVAGFLEGAAQMALWVVALAVDYLGALVGRARGWRVSPSTSSSATAWS